MDHIYLIGDGDWDIELDRQSHPHPIGYIDTTPIFEGDCTELCCPLSSKPDPNEPIYETPFWPHLLELFPLQELEPFSYPRRPRE